MSSPQDEFALGNLGHVHHAVQVHGIRLNWGTPQVLNKVPKAGSDPTSDNAAPGFGRQLAEVLKPIVKVLRKVERESRMPPAGPFISALDRARLKQRQQRHAFML